MTVLYHIYSLLNFELCFFVVTINEYPKGYLMFVLQEQISHVNN